MVKGWVEAQVKVKKPEELLKMGQALHLGQACQLEGLSVATIEKIG